MPAPPFPDTPSALRFAFAPHAAIRDSLQRYPVSTPTLGADAAAQAGMIKLELQACGDRVEHIITARFAPRLYPCTCNADCCSGYRHGIEWVLAVEWITEQALERLKGRVANRRLRESIVRRYFGEAATMGELAAYALAHRDTVSDQNTILCAWLHEVEDAAVVLIDGRLRQSGMIPAN